MRPARTGVTVAAAVGVAVAAGMVPALAATRTSDTSTPTRRGVDRSAMETITIADTYGTNPGFTHNYTGVWNPCTGAFTGSGMSGDQHQESITGTFTGTTLTYTATYNDNGLTWSIAPATVDASGAFSTTGTITLPASAAGTAPVTGTVSVSPMTGEQEHLHGWYVRQNPGEASAHSCLGMPDTANRPEVNEPETEPTPTPSVATTQTPAPTPTVSAPTPITSAPAAPSTSAPTESATATGQASTSGAVRDSDEHARASGQVSTDDTDGHSWTIRWGSLSGQQTRTDS